MVQDKKIKVLWFANTSVDYSEYSSGYNGGGWMSALKDKAVEDDKIDLAIAFYASPGDAHLVKKSVSYYPISFNRKISARLKRAFSRKQQEYDHILKFKSVIDSFKPDLVHVFGTERPFGLVAQHTDVPTVIHLQGLINPYLNALLPPFYSRLDFFIDKGFNPWSIIKNINSYLGWKAAAVREKKIFEGCKNFMGRTHWDKAICKILSPNATYFYCSEILRSEFSLNQKNIKRDISKKIRIVSTISDPHYKGVDIILKTAKILKSNMNLDFEWSIFGVSDIDYASSKLGIDAVSNNITLKGVVCAAELATSLSNASIYVHSSYIDNSPNSICEAQVIGTPVIANDVGGVSSLIAHNKTGFLTPANDPFMMAHYIKELGENLHIRERISRNAQSIAIKRHDPNIIIESLFDVYKKILD
jgi:glycosyltransferase involved in cell wall biosynthesis